MIPISSYSFFCLAPEEFSTEIYACNFLGFSEHVTLQVVLPSICGRVDKKTI